MGEEGEKQGDSIMFEFFLFTSLMKEIATHLL